MKKVFLIIILFSFICSQNMGILKTKKNKSGLGVLLTSNYIYKVDETGKHILDKPEKIIDTSFHNPFTSL